jgi:hypothetical protein
LIIVPASIPYLIAKASPDGRTVTARRLIVVDGQTSERVQVWPAVERPVLSVTDHVVLTRLSGLRRFSKAVIWGILWG